MKRRLPVLFLMWMVLTGHYRAVVAQEQSPFKPLELPPVAENVRYSPADWALARQQVQAASADRLRDFATIDQGPTEYYVFHMEFRDPDSCRAFNVPGTHAIARFDRFLDVFVPATEQAVNAVNSAPGLVWWDFGTKLTTPPPPPAKAFDEKTRQIPADVVRGGVDGLTGRGVTIAIIDSGVDFRHPDFITYDSEGRPTSRLLYLWDTESQAHSYIKLGSPAPVTYPNSVPIGTVYSRDELTADLRGQKRIPVADLNGHGTGCAGVAAGNGNASGGRNIGVAPAADIIAVRLGGSSPDDGSLRNAWLLGAICEWLDRVAGNRPLVVSCSFGHDVGGCDGFEISERHLSARFSPDRRGRALCIAAGNAGSYPIHAEATVDSSAPYETVEWETNEGAHIYLYVQTNNLDDLVRGFDGSAQLQVAGQPYRHALTDQFVVTLQSGPGTGRLSLASKSGQPFRVDAYILGGRFVGSTLAATSLVGSPGCCHNAITVGSFDWNDEFEMHGRPHTLDFAGHQLSIGDLSIYSSPGPLRFGNVVKPDIVGAGQWHPSCVPVNLPHWQYRDSTGFYQPFNGTSAATPYVAGVVALIMERKPDITVGELKELLWTSATRDQFTGQVPNGRWGYGKIDLAAVRKMLARIGGTRREVPGNSNYDGNARIQRDELKRSLTALAATDPAERITAIHSLAKRGPSARPAASFLYQIALNDESADVRKAARESLERILGKTPDQPRDFQINRPLPPFEYPPDFELNWRITKPPQMEQVIFDDPILGRRRLEVLTAVWESRSSQYFPMFMAEFLDADGVAIEETAIFLEPWGEFGPGRRTRMVIIPLIPPEAAAKIRITEL